MRKVSFQAIEDVLYYEMHPRALREEHQSLGDTLVQMGVLSKDTLKQALAEQRRTGRLLGKILLEGQYVTPQQCAQALARQYSQYAALESTQSTVEALQLVVPEGMAKKHAMLPVDVSGDRITVLISDPQVRDRLNEASVLGQAHSPHHHRLRRSARRNRAALRAGTRGKRAPGGAAAQDGRQGRRQGSRQGRNRQDVRQEIRDDEKGNSRGRSTEN